MHHMGACCVMLCPHMPHCACYAVLSKHDLKLHPAQAESSTDLSRGLHSPPQASQLEWIAARSRKRGEEARSHGEVVVSELPAGRITHHAQLWLQLDSQSAQQLQSLNITATSLAPAKALLQALATMDMPQCSVAGFLKVQCAPATWE